MALGIVQDQCQRNGNRGTVVVEGNSPNEVMSKEAREMALSHAATLGISRPGLGTGGGPYPVNAQGEAGDPVQTANAGGCKYRYDWPVQGGL